jgi:hypothetical protein
MPLIGPKTNSVEKISELRQAGVNVGELRFLSSMCHLLVIMFPLQFA